MDIQPETTREQYFIQQMMSARREEMTNMLRCKLCEGLLRFAHTLVDCGHTFCQQCVFTYIRGFKGKRPEVKCPQCHAPLETPFARSIMRDVFKQSLVDALQPSFAAREKLLVERIGALFPSFNLTFLLQQFSFSSRTIAITQLEVLRPNSEPTRRKSQKSRLMSGLANVVKQKLGLSFQAFSEQIRDDEGYQGLVDRMSGSEKAEIEATVVEVKPRSERDFRFVGINNKMKLNNPGVEKIRKYLQKKLLQRMQENEEMAQELVRALNIKNGMLDFYLDGRLLEENQSLVGLAQGHPLYYTLKNEH